MQQQINELSEQVQYLQQMCDRQQQTINRLITKCATCESQTQTGSVYQSKPLKSKTSSTQTNTIFEPDHSDELQKYVVTQEELSECHDVDEYEKHQPSHYGVDTSCMC